MAAEGRFILVVDGPAGSGKGTVCRAVARHFGWAYLDTGAIYRALGLLALDRNEDDPLRLSALAETMDFRFQENGTGDFSAYLDGREVTLELRREEVGAKASRVAAEPLVRKALLQFQRAYAGQGNLIADGRDLGSTVFPQADLKIFLSASIDERAKRRALELQARGEAVNFAHIREQIVERDARDAGRAHAPMEPAADAIVVDTTSLSIAETVLIVVRLAGQRLGQPLHFPSTLT